MVGAKCDRDWTEPEAGSADRHCIWHDPSPSLQHEIAAVTPRNHHKRFHRRSIADAVRSIAWPGRSAAGTDPNRAAIVNAKTSSWCRFACCSERTDVPSQEQVLIDPDLGTIFAFPLSESLTGISPGFS
jgi:hypothetical protein